MASLADLINGNGATDSTADMGSRQSRLQAFTGVQPAPAKQSAADETLKRNEQGWKEFFDDPRVKSGLLQFGINMLSGDGFGNSVGSGLAAVGRSEEARVAEEERQRQAQLDERSMRIQEEKLHLSQRAASVAARGGSRSSAAAPRVPTTDWAKRIQEWDKTQAETNLDYTGMNPAQMDDFARFMSSVELVSAVNPNINPSNAWDLYVSDRDQAWAVLQSLGNEPDVPQDPVAAEGEPISTGTAQETATVEPINLPDTASPMQQDVAQGLAEARAAAERAAAAKAAERERAAAAAAEQRQIGRNNFQISKTYLDNLMALRKSPWASDAERDSTLGPLVAQAWPFLTPRDREVLKNSSLSVYIPR